MAASPVYPLSLYRMNDIYLYGYLTMKRLPCVKVQRVGIPLADPDRPAGFFA